MGWCAICGTPEPRSHVNDCPWPRLRQLLDTEDAARLARGERPWQLT